ncbi:hypothetical protein NDU88_005833, partial [Pleurodeles waltl]
MQGAIRWVAKTCTDFAIRIGEAETHTSKLEDDTAMQGEIRESLRIQMEDTQWKMADLENRARQNNLRVLSIPEGLEGPDPRSL